MKKLPNKWLRLLPAMFVAFAVVAVACGGGSGSGSDADYVKAVCKAGNNFDDALEDVGDGAAEIFANADSEADANAKLAELFVGPFKSFANDLDKANPPADVKENHEDLVAALRTMVKQIEDGDLDALDDSEDLFDGIEPSQAIQDRLQAVSETVSECDGQDFFS